jgi:hypothetical protein
MVLHYSQRNHENDYYMDGEKLQAAKEKRDNFFSAGVNPVLRIGDLVLFYPYIQDLG